MQRMNEWSETIRLIKHLSGVNKTNVKEMQGSLDFSFLSVRDCFTSSLMNDCTSHSVNVRKDPETELLLAMAHKLKKGVSSFDLQNSSGLFCIVNHFSILGFKL